MPKTVKHYKPPINHASGKPVRGVRGPGVRGPNKHADEILAEKVKKQTQIIVQSARPPTEKEIQRRETLTGKASHLSTNKHAVYVRANRRLQGLIREIGDEQVSEQLTWTRIEAVVRSLYAESLKGKVPAMQLLFERGWGRVPLPVSLDIRTEMLEIMKATGLTPAEIEGDPVLREIMGEVLEGEYSVTQETRASAEDARDAGADPADLQP